MANLTDPDPLRNACRWCAAPLQAGGRFCPFCGKEQPVAELATASTPGSRSLRAPRFLPLPSAPVELDFADTVQPDEDEAIGYADPAEPEAAVVDVHERPGEASPLPTLKDLNAIPHARSPSGTRRWLAGAVGSVVLVALSVALIHATLGPPGDTAADTRLELAKAPAKETAAPSVEGPVVDAAPASAPAPVSAPASAPASPLAAVAPAAPAPASPDTTLPAAAVAANATAAPSHPSANASPAAPPPASADTPPKECAQALAALSLCPNP